MQSREYVNEYKDSRRFNIQASNNIQATQQITRSVSGESLIPSRIDQIMIEIGQDGKKYLVNSNKQKAIILPKPYKFFHQLYRGQTADPVKTHKQQLKFQKIKTGYNKHYQTSMSSIIYRYQIQQIQLFSQLYADEINVQEKKIIEGEFYQLKKRFFQSKLCFFGLVSLYFNVGRRPWMKLTRNNYLWMAGLTFYALILIKSRIDYKRRIITSILKYSTIYERVNNQYENDYGINNL